MIRSMTAYGRAKTVTEQGSVTVELKSVNSRYFDCTVKMPRAYLFLEERIKSYVRDCGITRGKVDVYVTVESAAASPEISVDMTLAESYVRALRQLRDSLELADDISVMTVAKNTALFSSTAAVPEAEPAWQMLLPALEQATAAFRSMAEAEGARTAEDITSKMETVRALAREAETLYGDNVAAYRTKLEERIRRLLSDHKVALDEQRILTECAIVADRLAVDEEIARLGSHVSAFYEILREGSPCGKKLDFLLQECNRETNTLGSKANDAGIARVVVSMKNELEKIREQIQNIE